MNYRDLHLQQRLAVESVSGGRSGVGAACSLWRFLVAGLALLRLAATLLGPPGDRCVCPLKGAGGMAGRAGARGFGGGAAGDGLRVRVLTRLAEQAAGRDLELWEVLIAGVPRSLGLLAAQGATKLQFKRALMGAVALAVTQEPRGGSPTGVPTGPVVWTGEWLGL